MKAKTAIKRIVNLIGDCPELGKEPRDFEVACDLLKVQDEILTQIYKICWEVE